MSAGRRSSWDGPQRRLWRKGSSEPWSGTGNTETRALLPLTHETPEFVPDGRIPFPGTVGILARHVDPRCVLERPDRGPAAASSSACPQPSGDRRLDPLVLTLRPLG